MSDTSKSLRKAADEIENEGHLGWGNTCRWAADEFDALASRLAEAERDAARYRAIKSKAVDQHDLEAFVALGALDYCTSAQFDEAVEAITAITDSAPAAMERPWQEIVKDATRYMWLRRRVDTAPAHGLYPWSDAAAMDAAIDAGMAATSQPGEAGK